MIINKRIFAFVIAFTLIIGTFGTVLPVLAEETDTQELSMIPEDVIGTDYESAVRRLVAFGLIEGYPDGTYKPEREVNRAQFAKLIIHALGLEDSAMAVQGGSTGFSDVNGDHWAAGYINIANTQGLIKGYPDGSFRPGDKVTYEHTLTILVRALGYEDEFLPGKWPNNYIAKANETGITRGSKLPANFKEGGKRGIVAQLIDNTLDSKVVEIAGYAGASGVQYTETDETLLMNRLEISRYEDTRVIGDKIIDESLLKDQVRVRFLENIDANRDKGVKKSYNKDDKNTFKSKFNVRPFIGEEVTTYITDRDEVIYVERENDDRWEFDYVEKVIGEKLSLVQFNREYEFEETAEVYVFDSNSGEYKLHSGSNVRESELLGRMGKFVIRNNRIVFAEILDPAQVNSEFLVVMKNEAGLIEGLTGTSEAYRLNLKDNQDYDYSLIHNTKGEELGLKDIREGNLLYIQKQNYDGDEIARVTVVQNNRLEGKLGKIQKDNFEIGGKTVDVIKAGNSHKAYYKVDEYDGVKAWSDSSWNSDMRNVDGKSAIAYTDAVGRVAFLDVKDGDSSYKFGIVTRSYADKDRVKIFTTVNGEAGKETIFKVERGMDLSTDGKLVGAGVKFRLNSDGEIVKDGFTIKPYGTALKMAKNEDFGTDIIKADNGKSYAINTDNITVIEAPNVQDKAPMDITGVYGELQGETYGGDKEIDTKEFKTKTWADVKGMEYDRNVQFYLFTKDGVVNEVEGLIFIGEGSADEVALYVLDQWRRGSETVVDYVTYPDGEKRTRPVEEVIGLKGDLKEKTFIGEEKSTGELVLYYEIPKAEEEYFEYRVIRNVTIDKVSGDYIQVKGENINTEGAIVYKGDSSRTPSYLKQGNKVDIVMEGNRARLVQLIVES